MGMAGKEADSNQRRHLLPGVLWALLEAAPPSRRRRRKFRWAT
jgi:hypothetical protein